MKIDNKKLIKWQDGLLLLLIILSIENIFYIFVKMRLNIVIVDELFYAATGDMFSKGNTDYLVDSYSSLQFIGLILAPLENLFVFLTGGMDGLIYFFRILFVLIQDIIAVAGYLVLRRFVSIKNSIIGAVCFFSFAPFVQSINYKQMLNMLMISSLLTLMSYWKKPRTYKCILLGVFIAFSSLFFETSALMILPFTVAIIVISKELKLQKDVLVVNALLPWIVCAVIASLFFIPIIYNYGFCEVIYIINKLLFYDAGFKPSLMYSFKEIIPYFAAFIVYSLFVTFVKNIIRNHGIQINDEKYYTIACIIASISLVFIGFSTVGVNRIGYYLLVVMFIVFFYDKKKESDTRKRKIYFYLFIIPSLVYIIIIAAASNTGLYFLGMPGIFGFILLLLISEDHHGVFDGSAMFSVVFVAVAMALLNPVQGKTIFNRTNYLTMSNGVLTGIVPMSADEMDNYVFLSSLSDKYIPDGEDLLVINTQNDPYLDLESSPNIYAQPSPGPYYSTATGVSLAQFYEHNSERRPTLIVFSENTVGESYSTFCEKYTLGQYIADNSYSVEIHEGYYFIRCRK